MRSALLPLDPATNRLRLGDCDGVSGKQCIDCVSYIVLRCFFGLTRIIVDRADILHDQATLLFVQDEDAAKRTARALMHAALQCGGSKAVSPF